MRWTRCLCIPGIQFYRRRLQIRAEIAQANRSLDQLAVDGLAKVRRDCKRKRDRLRTLRATPAERRRTLNAARFLPPQSHTLTRSLGPCPGVSRGLSRCRSRRTTCSGRAIRRKGRVDHWWIGSSSTRRCRTYVASAYYVEN
ncbi:hypothetical protein DEU56DRAFT_80602 [Suillus clintonianus]|uniref:uncharacterized protein n=1 Tax=Suillus clintonianus TaxID=1904413 RepID=UPI001B875EC7|nr:uncharacterized protein DEU56DRAFT_80602 [Suillus clintonianus]KAG2148780.1 hypothetical protein DEU56DRAFT_80602 [Suillus clintonianus]